MHRKLGISRLSPRVQSAVIPDIRAVPAILTEFEVVDVGCWSGFEGQDQLVTRPIRIAVWTGVTRDTRPKPDMELVGFTEREIWNIRRDSGIIDCHGREQLNHGCGIFRFP
jgi:hypothetical protein